MKAIDRQQLVAFRLAAHGLTTPAPAARWTEALAVGLQDTPPGAAGLALAARVDGLDPAVPDRALATDRTVLQAWSLRHSPILFATPDLPVFTEALAPQTDAEMVPALAGFAGNIPATGRPPTEVVAEVAGALRDALDGTTLTKRGMGAALRERLPHYADWFEPSAFTRFGALVVRPIALTGLFCFVPRRGNESTFVRTDQWLGAEPPTRPAIEAAADLARRYLDRYGPATVTDMAGWAFTAESVAARGFDRLRPELVEVDAGGRRGWLHRDCLPLLESPPDPPELVMVPAYDPFLYQSDRETLVPDGSLRKRIWQKTANPGVVLRAGEVVAVWRHQKEGSRLVVAVEPVAALHARDRTAIDGYAARFAPWRGCRSATVTYPQ